MDLSNKELEALSYYLSHGSPDTSGYHGFEVDSHSGVDEPTTWINGTDYTESELAMLEQGEAVKEQIEQKLSEFNIESISFEYDATKEEQTNKITIEVSV